MLLLVMQPDRENAHDLRELGVRSAVEQSLDRSIDVCAERGDLGAARTGQKPALRACVTWSGRDVIRVEEISVALVKDAIAGEMWHQQELFEEPGGVRAMPFGRAGIGHGLHDLILGAQGR